MKRIRFAVLSFFLAVMSLPLMRNAQADASDKKTDVTFSQPVEVPGTVLSAGTYVFKLAESNSSRNIVQILNKDENHVYATILAITAQRPKPADKTVITFEEHAKGAPEAVRAWFYPGENTGVRFVYPKQKAMEIGRSNNESVPAMTSPPTSEQAATTPVAVADTQSQVAALRDEPVQSAAPQGDVTPVDQSLVVKSDPPATMPQLPKTASELPLLLVWGSASLLGIVPVQFLSRRGTRY